MAYRNGTYVAFHAKGTSNPIVSDMKYYNLIKAWDKNKSIEFTFVNSHEKTYAVRDDSKRTTLKERINERLRNSKQLVLIVTNITKNDKDWVPYEIEKAIDNYELPIICIYPKYRAILVPGDLSKYWPNTLSIRITRGKANTIHIPFNKVMLIDAIKRFDVHNNLLKGGLNYFDADYHKKLHLLQTNENPNNKLIISPLNTVTQSRLLRSKIINQLINNRKK